MEIKIEPGTIFGYWKVIEKTQLNPIKYLCLCLGCNLVEKEVLSYSLRTNKSKSCGCKTSETIKNFWKEIAENKEQIEEITARRKATNIEKYGCASPLQNPAIKEKARSSCLERYGVLYPSQLEEVREKIKKTIQEKYGVDKIMDVEEFKEKRQKTIEEKYGVTNVSKLESIKDKKRQTCLSNYGDVHFLKTKKGQETYKKTCMEKYNVENISQLDSIKKIVKVKKRETCLLKYNVEYPAQNKDIALKGVRSRRNRIIKFHWRTGEELVCIGSYESKVVDYLNHNKINYLWQPKVFPLTTGKTYRPDLYLEDKDLWIEIKGRFLNDAEQKWIEFHTTICLNSELWNKEKLKELKIL